MIIFWLPHFYPLEYVSRLLTYFNQLFEPALSLRREQAIFICAPLMARQLVSCDPSALLFYRKSCLQNFDKVLQKQQRLPLGMNAFATRRL